MHHSRKSEIAKTGVEENIGKADGLEGELHDVVRNPAIKAAHPEPVEGMTKK